MTNTMRVSEPQELLALIPYQLGFQPNNSLVVMSLRGERCQVGLMARCELDELTSDRGQELAQYIIQQCRTDNANKIFLAFYFDHQEPLTVESEFSEEQTVTVLQAFMAYRVFMKQLGDSIGLDGIWVVGPETYFDWAAYEPQGCAPHCARPCTDQCSRTCSFECPLHTKDGAIKLRSVTEFQSTEVSATMVLNGQTYRRNRAELGVVKRASKQDRDKAGASYRRYRARQQSAQDRDAINLWEQQALNLWLHVLADAGYQRHHDSGCHGGHCNLQDLEQSGQGSSITPVQIGKLAAGMSSRRVRDAVLLSLTPDGEATAKQFLASQLDRCHCGPNNTSICSDCPKPMPDLHGETLVNDALAKIVSPARGVAPTSCMSELAQALLEAIIASVMPSLTAPQHALMCLLAWWQGNGAVARCHNDLALKVDEHYRLANLLATVLDAGLAPGWVRRNKT